MPTQLQTRNAVIVEEEVREDARAVVEEMHDRRITGATLVLDDGQQIELPARLASTVRFVIAGLTQGDLSIRAMPNEVTSTTAADILGVSRPTLMKLAADGVITAKKVGSHSRFEYREIVRLSEQRRAARREAFEALRAFDEEHETADDI